MGFMDLEKVYYRVNREVLWQVLIIYDVDVDFLRRGRMEIIWFHVSWKMT